MINYDKLLYDWNNHLLSKADELLEESRIEGISDTRSSYLEGYSRGIFESSAYLTLLKNKYVDKYTDNIESNDSNVKFKVIRSSSNTDEEEPCEGVKKERYTRVEVRTLGSFEEFYKKFGEIEGEWESKGVNHCINEQGYIQREFPGKAVGWFIEFSSLDELMAFREKYGNLIITRDMWNPNVLVLEIYDDYRE